MMRWRAMVAGDIPDVARLSDAIHGTSTERPEIYAERLRLYPAGCRMLDREGRGLGYLIAHPWHGGQPPVLDAPIGHIPADADRFYIHDLALAPEARGTGMAQAGIAILLEHARSAGFHRVALTAVNGAETFWEGQGFRAIANASAYGQGSLAMERRL